MKKVMINWFVYNVHTQEFLWKVRASSDIEAERLVAEQVGLDVSDVIAYPIKED